MHKIQRFIILAIFLLISVFDVVAQGCVQCKSQIESSEQNELTIGNGINVGITILMLSPYIILFVIFRKKIFSFLKEFSGMWKK